MTMPWWAWILATLSVVGLVLVAAYYALVIWLGDNWRGT